MMFVKRKHSGFTLMELMIVLAIIGILAAIAYPSYEAFIRKAARTEAKTTLYTIAQKQEIYYISSRTYGELNSGAPLDYAAATISVDKDGNIGVLGVGLYDITMSLFSASSYTIEATATNAQLKDSDCLTMTLNEKGVQSPAACW